MMEVSQGEEAAFAIPDFATQEDVVNINDIDGLIHQVTVSICEDFQNIERLAPDEAFERSYKICSDGAKAVAGTILRTGRREGRLTAQAKLLQAELHAYRLLAVAAELEEGLQLSKGGSLLAAAAAEENELKYLMVLLRWCEEVAGSEEDSFAELAADYSSMSGLLNAKSDTVHALRMRGGGGVSGGGQKGLGVDLDASSTQDEQQIIDKLFRVAFSLVRCGKVNEARQMLSRTGLSSVAALLSMRQLREDPNLTPSENDHPNYKILQRRKLFKSTVDKILSKSEGGSCDSSRRVLLSCLAGRLEPLLSLATRPEDRLWVMANAAVEARIDALQGDPLSSDVPLTVDSIFEEVLPHDSWPYFPIYRYLLTGDTAACILYCDRYLTEHAASAPDHISRFFAHIAVIFRQRGIHHDVSAGSRVILSYTGRLFKLSLTHLIPFYAAFLTNEMTRNQVMIQTMYNLKRTECRKAMLAAGRAAGMDMASLCHQVVVRGRQSKCPPAALLDRLEWLLLLKEEVQVTLVETNILLLQFLEAEDEESARTLLSLCADREGDLADRAEKTEGARRFSPLLLRAIAEHRTTLLYMAGVQEYSAWRVAHAEAMREEGQGGGGEGRAAGRARVNSMLHEAERALESRRVGEKTEKRKANLAILKQKAVETLERFVKEGGWRDGEWQVVADHDEEVRSRSLCVLRDRLFTRALSFCLQMHEESGEPAAALEVAALVPLLRLEQDITKSNLRLLLGRVHKVAGHTLV